MPITDPDSAQTIELQHGRGSAIQTADTYARPAIPQPDQGADQLVAALGGLGKTVTGIADQRAQQKEKEDMLALDSHVARITAEQGTSTVSDTQIGVSAPELSNTVRARVAQQLGSNAAAEYMSQQREQLLQDPALRLNPELMDQKLAQINADAAAHAQGNPFWGAGYAGGVKAETDRLRAAAQGERSKYYDQIQTENVQSEAQRAHDLNSPGIPPAALQASPSAQKLAALPPGSITTPMQIGLTILGANERQNAGVISAFIQKGTGKSIDPSVTPWCALTVDSILGQAGLPQTHSAAALSFKNYGADASKDPQVGDIVVFDRGGGHGHVGFLAGKNADGTINVLGGNQSNQFGVSTFNTDNVVAYRRATGVAGSGHEGQVGTFVAPMSAVAAVRRPTDGQFQADAKRLQYGGTPNDYIASLSAAESSNNPNAKNPNSSASGLMQFIDPTFVAMARKADATLAGKTDAQILAMKNDPTLQKSAALAYADQNSKTLTDANLPVTNANLHLSHFLDGKNAVKVLKASDGTPTDQLLSQDQINANPKVLKNKTAGQVKQWAQEQVGQGVDPALAQANGTRALDQQLAKSSSLNDIRRRDIFAKYYADRAVATGDKSYLQSMPKEWMTPEIQSQFMDAARKVDQYQWQQYERQKTMASDQREEQKRTEIQDIHDKIAQGQPVDFRQYKNPEASDYAYNIEKQERSIAPQDSTNNANVMDHTIAEAAQSGDYTKVDPSFTPGMTPDYKQLGDAINRRTDIKVEDKVKLINGLDKTLEVGKLVSSKDSKEFFSTNLKPFIDSYSKALDVQFSDGTMRNHYNLAGEATKFYENTVYAKMRVLASQPGGITEAGKRAVFEEAGEKTEAYLEKNYKILKEGGTPQRAKLDSSGDAAKGKFVAGPDGVKTWVPDGGGNAALTPTPASTAVASPAQDVHVPLPPEIHGLSGLDTEELLGRVSNSPGGQAIRQIFSLDHPEASPEVAKELPKSAGSGPMNDTEAAAAQQTVKARDKTKDDEAPKPKGKKGATSADTSMVLPLAKPEAAVNMGGPKTSDVTHWLSSWFGWQ